MSQQAGVNKVQGKGINNVGKAYDKDGKVLHWYQTWRGMLSRAYCKVYHKKHPTYVGTTVCQEWLIASNFKVWYERNHIEDWVLDKDLLGGESKIYSPSTCMYIPKEINSAIRSYPRGKYPRGVMAQSGKYLARWRDGFSSKSLGTFDTIEEASYAYLKYKNNHIIHLIKKYGLAI